MRSFKVNRDRSNLVIRSRTTGEVVGTITPHRFYKYHGNATAIDSKAISRKRRSK